MVLSPEVQNLLVWIAFGLAIVGLIGVVTAWFGTTASDAKFAFWVMLIIAAIMLFLYVR